MRINYLHQYFNTPQMPGSTRSYEFAKRLVAKGHEVNMITSWRNKNKNPAQIEIIDGINVHWINVPYNNKMNFGQRIKAFFSFALKAGKKSRAIPADIIFSSSTPLTIALPAVWAAKRQRIPMVFEVRDLWPQAAIIIGALKNPVLVLLARLLEKFAYKNSKKIIALAPRIANGIIKSGYDEKNIAIISNACDLEFFNPEKASAGWFAGAIPKQDDTIIATYAGTIGKVNNISYLIEIAKICRTKIPNLKFALVGDGNEKEKVKQLAKENDLLNKNIFFFDAVKKSEIPHILKSSSFCISLVKNDPKLSGDSANKFFDSLAAKKPVVINHGGWLADLLEEYGAGLVIPANDANRAAQSMGAWLADRNSLKQSSNGALKLAKSKFDRDKMAEKLETLLLEAIDS